MTGVIQFVQFNLLPALAAGAAVWLLVIVGLRLFGITQPIYRLCLMTAPLIKSTLVLVGVHALLPWPDSVFGDWQRQAVSAGTMVPVFAVLLVVALVVREVAHRRSRRVVLARAQPASDVSPRLAQALARVLDAYRVNQSAIAVACPVAPAVATPALLVTDESLASPVVMTSGAPTIVFPRQLADELSDDEIDGALAHEIAHVQLRQPLWCSAGTFQVLAGLNPVAMALASHFRREEEKACDDIAVATVGRPTTYAEMLLKSYRFADRQASPARLVVVHSASLLDWKPMITERIERLVHASWTRPAIWRQLASTAAVWGLIVAVFFAG